MLPDREYLQHILESAPRVLTYREGVTLEEFWKDRLEEERLALMFVALPPQIDALERYLHE